MSIEEAVAKALEQNSDRFETPAYRNLADFYEAKKREGAVIHQGYTLPLIDTVGQSLFALADTDKSE